MSTLLAYTYLEASEREANRDVQRCIDDACYWFDQRHEEQREPDDADEQHNNHATHPILHHLLLLLTSRLRITLEHTNRIKRSTEINYFLLSQFGTQLYCIYIHLIHGSGSYPRNTGCDMRIHPEWHASASQDTIHSFTHSFTHRANLEFHIVYR